MARSMAIIRRLACSVLIGTLIGTVAGSLGGQTASATPPAPVFSIGQPPIWRQQLTAQGTAYSDDDHWAIATFS